MKSTNEEVILQGIEFWSNVCEEEINLACEAEEVTYRRFALIQKI